MKKQVFIGLAAAVLSLAGCQSARETQIESGPRAQLFDGMGRHSRKVSAANNEAQRYVDQGLTWAFAFNHDEAIRSFSRAAELSTDCAMAYWGVALCNGPHINNPIMPETRSKAAWDALEQAIAHKNSASPVERRLIEALANRYAWPAPADRTSLDTAYANAMRAVYRDYPNDADVATLFAESMMDLRPWNLWQKDGQPYPGTEELIAAIEHALKLDPNHPGACHLYIHAVESSPRPERAVAAADRLRHMVPIAGHLVHMPSHIDIRVGRYDQASQANERAIKADGRYRKLSPKQDFYRVYMAHNQHFLAFSSMMEGRYESAINAARTMLAGIPADYARENAALVDPFMMIELDVLKRFGRWDDILKYPEPAGHFPISTALWHGMRGVAFAARGEVENAQREQAAFREAAKKVPADALTGINPASKILAIADKFLSGEIAYRQGKIDVAVADLREAAALEDDLLYMEPPEWIQPVRHALGAILLDADRAAEAEQVFRDDLKKWPENGWSLNGLERSLRMQRRTADAASVAKRFEIAWKRADTPIAVSCLCVARNGE